MPDPTSLRRRLSMMAALLCSVATLVSGCGEPPDDPGRVDRPRLRLPLEVYPGQSFLINASLSSFGEEAIRGYAIDFGDGTPPVVVKNPEVAYHYETQGRYTVRLRMWDGHSIDHAAIQVISCYEHLRCGPLPERPCPAGYRCDAGSAYCAPEQVACTADDDCPADLRCLHGACGAGGLCGDAAPFDPPPVSVDFCEDDDDCPDDASCVENTCTTATDCETHSDCPDDAFCVEGACRAASCDAACEDAVVRSYLLAPVSGLFDAPMSGVSANLFEPQILHFIESTGRLWTWWGETEEEPPPGDAPPAYFGRLWLEETPSIFFGAAPEWFGFDIAQVPNGGEFAFLATSTAVSSREGLALGDSDLNVAPLFEPFPDAFIGELSSAAIPALSNSSPGGELFVYQMDSGAVQMASGEQLLTVATYLPMPGASVCGFATDGERVFFAENRSGDAGAASRIVSLSLGEEATPQFIPSPLTQACGLEIDPNTPDTLLVTAFDGAPFLVILRVD